MKPSKPVGSFAMYEKQTPPKSTRTMETVRKKKAASLLIPKAVRRKVEEIALIRQAKQSGKR